ncbi:diguanylate cyclase [Novosphingobium sp. BW1]|nr:diguanylate cyclase [Novosphingobium sp. BW1]
MFPRARPFLFCLLILFAGVIPGFAQAANDFPAQSRCHALAPADTPPAWLARTRAAWNCSHSNWQVSGSQASFVRIDVAGRKLPQDAVLTTRLTRYRSLSITAIGANGRNVTRQIPPGALHFSTTRWQMYTALPRLDGPVEAYVLKVTGPRHIGLLSDAQIGARASPMAVGNRQLILAALCGLMLMPLILNFVFFRILRQRFILWHAAAVLAMLTQTLVSSGLINRFVRLSVTEVCLLSTLSWAFMVIATLRFFIGLIEPETLSARQRFAVELLCPWFLFWSAYYFLADGVLLPSVAPLYYMSFLPIIATLLATIVLAALRGSRLVCFQIVGWTPLMLLGIARNLSILGLTDAPLGLMVEQHFAIAFEVAVTTLGVAERIMTIRLQRDHALAEARFQANLALHDPLTGLCNRRAIEEKFDTLFRTGFHTMAALDIDHFKAINDTHGHAAGDEVLRAVAEALTDDQDILTVRMGGEEFLLLLRGEDALERAERLRQAIPSRVAKQHAGLRKLVTASMGVYRPDTSPAHVPSFTEAYTACDELLYAAKAAGRDCVRSNVSIEPLPTTRLELVG